MKPNDISCKSRGLQLYGEAVGEDHTGKSKPYDVLLMKNDGAVEMFAHH